MILESSRNTECEDLLPLSQRDIWCDSEMESAAWKVQHGKCSMESA